MVLRKIGCDEIMLDLFLSYILMRTRGPSSMIVVGFWKILRVYFFLYMKFCILGLTTAQSLCCRIFIKFKGVILMDK